ncbi:hypothetical protein BC826DRAFT_981762 [Russula brevipes]|nr:hypothetical protein BC826DRAFT_981762 [Russula brevipes]
MTTTSSNPMYISAHSAEAILSDFRPLKLQPEALGFLNLLLDDILTNIISSSRSILTDRLKSGLLQTVPTPIGKDAVLEAEMELRAYWQRPNAVKPSPSQASASESTFSLPSMIELMRLKCEAYSTLNDSDEDAQAENKIQERLRSQGMEPPKSIIVAPAALYLTAVLECICERILSSVGRVATRDSSKDSAGTHDLFIGLCEDDAIYPIFKGSSVYEAIESSLKHSSKLQRSIARSERHENRDVQLAERISLSRSRLSSESAASGAVSGSAGSDNPPTRTSLEKGKAIKIFRPSSDRDVTFPSDAASRVSANKRGPGAQSDGINDSVIPDSVENNFTQDFDDLMRSGDTMKVSLTPDRLRSMEAAKQQRQLQTTTRRAGNFVGNDDFLAHSPSNADGRHSLSPDKRYHGAKKPSLPHVDSIIEDEEPKETAISPRAVQSRSVPKPSDVRARSVSASGISHGLNLRIPRKSSLNVKSPPPSYNAPNSSPATPRRVRKMQRNRESMDLDDIMNGSEGSESSPDPGDRATPGRVRPYPVSKATRDLISFLEEGPPPEVQPARPATISTVSLTPTTKSGKSGSRLQRMISKLNLSKEDRTLQDPQRGRGIGITSAPSTPSATTRFFGANLAPPLPPAVKPVPPPVLSIPPSTPISPPPSSQPSPDDEARSSDRRPRRKMSVRKAVPAWEATTDQSVPTPQITGASRTPSSRSVHVSSSSLPSASPTPPIPNEQSQPQSPPTPAPEAKEVNGHTRDSHKSLPSDPPVASPIPLSTGLETPSHSPALRENENGQTEQLPPQGISRLKSSRPNHRSSMNDEQASSTRRSSGRQPKPSSPQPIAPTHSLPESLALDMRMLMSQATTADECRLLLDTFLTRAGIPLPFVPVLDASLSDDEPLERTLVHHFLGEDLDESQPSHVHPVTAKQLPPTPSISEHPQAQDSGDLHQSVTTTPMDSASAVHAHHIVSAAVAVVS